MKAFIDKIFKKRKQDAEQIKETKEILSEQIEMAQLGEIARVRDESTYRGVAEPRIHTKLNDLPSLGQQMIKFCEEIGFELMPWLSNSLIN